MDFHDDSESLLCGYFLQILSRTDLITNDYLALMVNDTTQNIDRRFQWKLWLVAAL